MTTATIPATLVNQFRQTSGLPLMECKRLLVEADGDLVRASELAKRQGLNPGMTPVDQRPGHVGHYMHHNGQFGAVVILRSTSDTLSKTEPFRDLADQIAMHVAVADPKTIRRDTIPASIMETIKQEVTAEAFAKMEGKTIEVAERILANKLEARLKQLCLLEQPYIKDEKVTIGQMLDDLSRRSREPVEVSSFQRFKV